MNRLLVFVCVSCVAVLWSELELFGQPEIRPNLMTPPPGYSKEAPLPKGPPCYPPLGSGLTGEALSEYQEYQKECTEINLEFNNYVKEYNEEKAEGTILSHEYAMEESCKEAYESMEEAAEICAKAAALKAKGTGVGTSGT
jgi:hypothetical protein